MFDMYGDGYGGHQMTPENKRRLTFDLARNTFPYSPEGSNVDVDELIARAVKIGNFIFEGIV